jgi:hypothetical protein
MLASLFMFWPNEIGFVFDFFYFDDRKETDIFLQIGKVKYPFCIFSEISYFLGPLQHQCKSEEGYTVYKTSEMFKQNAIKIKNKPQINDIFRFLRFTLLQNGNCIARAF